MPPHLKTNVFKHVYASISKKNTQMYILVGCVMHISDPLEAEGVQAANVYTQYSMFQLMYTENQSWTFFSR